MSLNDIEIKCKNCTRCDLHKSKTNTVFGSGPADAKLIFVGEAPGETEDLSGVPFVGKAGKLFDKFLFAVDIKRSDIYITNILKCRPPKNRDPLPEEQDMCISWLREQVRLIHPKLIVCLGRISAMRLIKPDFKITQEHGKWFEKGGYHMCAVYHPSLLLRDPHKREDMLIDMKAVRDKLNALDAAVKDGN